MRGSVPQHVVLVLQSSDQEHGEEEAVRGQQGPDFLRVPKKDCQENCRHHDARANSRRSHCDYCADLAGRRSDGHAEQPFSGPANQKTEDSR